VWVLLSDFVIGLKKSLINVSVSEVRDWKIGRRKHRQKSWRQREVGREIVCITTGHLKVRHDNNMETGWQRQRGEAQEIERDEATLEF